LPYCSTCGVEIAVDARFCISCGASISHSSTLDEPTKKSIAQNIGKNPLQFTLSLVGIILGTYDLLALLFGGIMIKVWILGAITALTLTISVVSQRLSASKRIHEGMKV